MQILFNNLLLQFKLSKKDQQQAKKLLGAKKVHRTVPNSEEETVSEVDDEVISHLL
jgi:hypothetical protein